MIELIPLVGVSTVASPMEVGADRAEPALSDLVAVLRGNGVDVIPFSFPYQPDDAEMLDGLRHDGVVRGDDEQH